MSFASMRLHHYAHSSASHRVRIVLALKGIDVEHVSVDMSVREQQGAAYAALNPQRMVPCLELQDGRVLAQSFAIIDYLDHLVPEPAIYPSDPIGRSQAMALALYIACETSPFQARSVRSTLTEEFHFEEAQDIAWITKWIRRGLGHVERFLQVRNRQYAFSFGEEPSIADIFTIPQLRNADRFEIATDDFPHLRRLNDNCHQHPAFAAAHPDRWI